ncbi:MAG: type II toxin-antitoxin system death-on-curing family toxin [Tannerellaceae bacterium]|jgi:death-on-curing protein|nr:type II toxin-antitoxin system death-on-curing family toxin [Tannerellaceae bacterium]
MNDEITYFTIDEAIKIHNKTIDKSGGGLYGARDIHTLQSVLDFIRNDLYYPGFEDKLTYLVYRVCTGHFFNDGNKRAALTIGAYFLMINQHYWAATQFLQRLEAIIYHIAASRIDDNLLKRIIYCCIQCTEFDEALKLDIIDAINNEPTGFAD